MDPRSSSRSGRRFSWLFLLIGAGVIFLLHLGLRADRTSIDRAFVDRVFAEPRFRDFAAVREVQEVRVVFFFDVECPTCALRLPEYQASIQARHLLWPDVTFSLELRHYPLEGECNPLWPSTTSTLGCEAAAILEAVRAQRGPDLVLAAAKTLMEVRHQTPSQMAQVVGIEADWLTANYAKLLELVGSDVELGSANGVLATPTVFINGLRVRGPSREAFEAILDRESVRIGRRR